MLTFNRARRERTSVSILLPVDHEIMTISWFGLRFEIPLYWGDVSDLVRLPHIYDDMA
jgi:hypothetical protein